MGRFKLNSQNEIIEDTGIDDIKLGARKVVETLNKLNDSYEYAAMQAMKLQDQLESIRKHVGELSRTNDELQRRDNALKQMFGGGK